MRTIWVPHPGHAPASQGTLGGEAAAASGLRLFADLEDPGAMAFTAAISSCGVAKEWESLGIVFLPTLPTPEKGCGWGFGTENQCRHCFFVCERPMDLDDLECFYGNVWHGNLWVSISMKH